MNSIKSHIESLEAALKLISEKAALNDSDKSSVLLAIKSIADISVQQIVGRHSLSVSDTVNDLSKRAEHLATIVNEANQGHDYFYESAFFSGDLLKEMSNFMKYVLTQDDVASAAMRWVGIDKSLPPEQKNIVVMLDSNIPLLGRNINGRFCEHDSVNDRFVEWMEGVDNGFHGISKWFEIADSDQPAKALDGYVLAFPGASDAEADELVKTLR